MSLNSKHPQYATFLEDWTKCRDAYRGERHVKEKGEAYLPATGGMVADNHKVVHSSGWHAYQAYKTRAVYHEFYAEAVETFIGMMWTKPPTIELPAALEPMLDQATIHGEGLMALLRRIHEQQLVSGRLGLLLDLPKVPDPAQPLPYIALYETEAIINWDDGSREDVTKDSLNLVVLDETEQVRTAQFVWQKQEKYRVLVLGDITVNEVKGPYSAGVFTAASVVNNGAGTSGPSTNNLTFTPEGLIQPSIRGKTLDKIPFVFINSKDIVSTPDKPPLLGLAELCMAIYRGEADYRQALFMQGQDTLVVIGGDDEKSYRIGAGASIVLKASPGADAKFIGVDSNGLTEMREALQNDKSQAQQKAGSLIDTRSKAKESGDALSTRLGAQTATLTQIACAACYGLENLLKMAAEWVGANPDEVKVMPNLEFEDEEMTGKDLIDLMSAKSMGAPLANETIHTLMQEKGLTEKSYEEELEMIQEEQPLVVGGSGAKTQDNASLNPDDPNYDPTTDPNYDPSKDPNHPHYVDPTKPDPTKPAPPKKK